jgi:hypothetical protein
VVSESVSTDERLSQREKSALFSFGARPFALF